MNPIKFKQLHPDDDHPRQYCSHSAPRSLDDGTTAPDSLDSSPSATWSVSTDVGSGIAYYEVAIGTTAGGSNIYGLAMPSSITCPTGYTSQYPRKRLTRAQISV